MKSIFLLFLTLTVVSCGVKVKSGLEGTQTNTSTPEALTASKWCVVSKLANGQLDVTRLRLSNDYLNLAKILVNPDQTLSLYQMGQQNKFKMKGGKVWIYSAEVTRISGTKNAAAQKNFSQQATLAKALGSPFFRPNKAMNVRYVNWFGDDKEIQYYPCGSFAKSLNSALKVSPAIEYNVKMSEIRGTFRNSNLDSYHALKAPMKYKNVVASAVSGTQWCGWNLSGQSVNSLIVLTIGPKTFRENRYENLFSRMSDGEIDTWFETRKFERLTFRKSQKGSTMSGTRREKLQGRSTLFKKNYSLFENAKGLTAFVALGTMPLDKNDLFFPCTDLRPLQGDAVFAEYFDRILEQERN